jgi:hypothetical protein
LRWPYRVRFFICKRWAFQKAKWPLLSAFHFLKHWSMFSSPRYPLDITGKKRKREFLVSFYAGLRPQQGVPQVNSLSSTSGITLHANNTLWERMDGGPKGCWEWWWEECVGSHVQTLKNVYYVGCNAVAQYKNHKVAGNCGIMSGGNDSFFWHIHLPISWSSSTGLSWHLNYKTATILGFSSFPMKISYLQGIQNLLTT